MTTSNRLRGNAIGVAGGMLLSTDALFIRLMHIDDAWTIVMIRGLLMWSTFLLTYVCVPQWRSVIGKPWPTRQNLVAALFFAAASTTFVNALAHGAVATVLVIISSTPFISAFFARIFFCENVDRAMLMAAMLGMLGVAVVMGGAPHGGELKANYFALATAVSMALAFLCSSRVEGGTVGLPSLGALIASLFVVVCQRASLHNLPILQIQNGGVWILIEGAIVMPVALGLLALSTRYVAAANTGLFLLLETALAPFWIWIVFNESPGTWVVFGGLLTISAVLIHFFHTSQRPSALPTLN
jgi:drug/metabolite transporter (DMT)-like permease